MNKAEKPKAQSSSGYNGKKTRPHKTVDTSG